MNHYCRDSEEQCLPCLNQFYAMNADVKLSALSGGFSNTPMAGSLKTMCLDLYYQKALGMWFGRACRRRRVSPGPRWRISRGELYSGRVKLTLEWHASNYCSYGQPVSQWRRLTNRDSIVISRWISKIGDGLGTSREPAWWTRHSWEL